MADYYVSSAAYSGIAAWQATHAYVIGDIIKPVTPVSQSRYALRCTTAGTSGGAEPSWSGNNNATTVSGSATFTNVTGQSTYFWTAAAGDHQTLIGAVSTNRLAAGDRIFFSSDHSETFTSGNTGGGNSITAGYGLLQFLSVNRAGSTPPVAADLAAGAAIIANTSLMLIQAKTNCYFYGIAFSTISAGGSITFNSSNTTVQKTLYFDTCSFFLNVNNSGNSFTGNHIRLVLDNTTLQFSHASQVVIFATAEIVWINTPTPIAGATFPTVLFSIPASNLQQTIFCRGLDLSSVTGTLVSETGASAGRCLFYGCKIASGATRYTGSSGLTTVDLVEYVNCFDGTNIFSESYQIAGSVVTETTITLSGGATDNVGGFSHKMVSGTNVDKFCNLLCSFWMDVNYTTLTVSKTATVEIISSTALNNDEIALYLEYEGTSSSPVVSFGDSFITTALTAAAAVTTSTATWNSSPATPQKQKLQVTFTPNHAGRVRGQVRLGKASATVYVNPQITIT